MLRVLMAGTSFSMEILRWSTVIITLSAGIPTQEVALLTLKTIHQQHSIHLGVHTTDAWLTWILVQVFRFGNLSRCARMAHITWKHGIANTRS